ncbi:tetraacyldisaccharide 4'-kinase, partial [Rhizobium ruizarguesonis]
RGDNMLAGTKVRAFAGIADPAKFFRTVESRCAEIVVAKSFGDHEHLTEEEIDYAGEGENFRAGQRIVAAHFQRCGE